MRPTPQSVLVIEGEGRRMILADGREARLRVAGRQLECQSGDSSLTASLLRAGSREAGSAEFILSVPGRVSRVYRGALEVRVRDGELVPAVVMDLEVAVASSVAAESLAGAPLAALEAQAIVTRSYYLAARRHSGFDFCDTTHCQFLRERPAAGSPASIATLHTRGLVLIYRGEVLPALFSASCGGRTRSLGDVGLSSQGYPYYSVLCEYCLHHAAAWTTVLSREEAAILASGRPTEAKRLRIDRQMGWDTIPGNNYALEAAGESLIARGKGHGHGVGLCQLGASGMAAEGQPLQDILNYYFPNTSLGAAENVVRTHSTRPEVGSERRW
jgi:stage II sporulation protein D